jgi:hypothetical protein
MDKQKIAKIVIKADRLALLARSAAERGKMKQAARFRERFDRLFDKVEAVLNAQK